MQKVEILKDSMLEVNLNTIVKVKEFVHSTSRHDQDIFITDGKYIIDAKSIMGVFSLDLTKNLYVYTEEQNILDNTELVNDLTKFTLNNQWI